MTNIRCKRCQKILTSKKKKLKKSELIEKLKEIYTKQNSGSHSDKESDHGDADDLLLQYIHDEDVTNAFEIIDKWYA